MIENMPEFATDSASTQADSRLGKTRILPVYRLDLFRDKIAGLDILDTQMDRISIWWRTIDRTAAWVGRTNSVLAIEDLPKQEREDAETGLASINTAFEEINSSLNDLLASKPSKIRQLSRGVIDFISPRKENDKADRLGEKIFDFNKEIRGPQTDQIIAFCEAYNETRDLNDTKSMRMKIAQLAFEEMVALFPRIRMWYQYEGIPEPTTVDQIDEEKDELVAALKSDLWDSDEIMKWQSVYEQNRKSMGKFRFEESVKKSFKFIFRSALGKTSPKYSAMHILIEAENVFQGIKDDDTLKEAWDYAAEQEEENNS
jgi:hypothetical protein